MVCFPPTLPLPRPCLGLAPTASLVSGAARPAWRWSSSSRAARPSPAMSVIASPSLPRCLARDGASVAVPVSAAVLHRGQQKRPVNQTPRPLACPSRLSRSLRRRAQSDGRRRRTWELAVCAENTFVLPENQPQEEAGLSRPLPLTPAERASGQHFLRGRGYDLQADGPGVCSQAGAGPRRRARSGARKSPGPCPVERHSPESSQMKCLHSFRRPSCALSSALGVLLVLKGTHFF